MEELFGLNAAFLICSQCKKALTPPVWSCVNGHCICGLCHGDIKNWVLIASRKCSECQNPINTRCLAIEAMLSKKTLSACSLKERGCSTEGTSQDMVAHARECEYRDIACLVSGCGDFIQLQNFERHVQDKHSQHIIQIKVAEFNNFNFNFPKHFSGKFMFLQDVGSQTLLPYLLRFDIQAEHMYAAVCGWRQQTTRYSLIFKSSDEETPSISFQDDVQMNFLVSNEEKWRERCLVVKHNSTTVWGVNEIKISLRVWSYSTEKPPVPQIKTTPTLHKHNNSCGHLKVSCVVPICGEPLCLPGYREHVSNIHKERLKTYEGLKFRPSMKISTKSSNNLVLFYEATNLKYSLNFNVISKYNVKTKILKLCAWTWTSGTPFHCYQVTITGQPTVGQWCKFLPCEELSNWENSKDIFALNLNTLTCLGCEESINVVLIPSKESCH